ncbi:MAG: exo-alpha-sialidase [Acidobacteria bacterium]|nr:exo-alpha-sialidase [Acidobacteriota bacterium]
MNKNIRMVAACAAVVVMGLAVVRGQMPATPVAAQRDQVTLAVPRHNNAAPWVASAGRFVAVTWGAALDGKWDIYLATSADEGRTFGTPVRVNTVDGDGRVGGEIPPRVALHLPAGASVPQVVVAWNAKDQGTEIKIARSRDFGKTFAAPASLQAPGAAGDRGWHALTIDAQGLAHVVWLDHRGLAEAKAQAGAAAAGHAAHEAAALDGVAMAMKSRLHYATYGDRATPEQMLAPGVCYCCKTALAPTAKGVLATWRHVYDGNMRDVAFTLLGTSGAAAPPRISADGWSINGCPDDGPALAVDASDRVHAIWPTVIPGDEPVGALFYASKAAAAPAFGARQRVTTLGSPKPSHPQVTLDGTGHLFVAWDEIVGGVRTAAWAEGTTEADGTLRLGAPARLAPAGPTQYPVMAPLAKGAIVAWVSGAQGSSVIRVRQLVAAGATVSAAR